MSPAANKYSLILILMLFLTVSTAHTKDLGAVGKTYPIKERDALEELETKAAKLNWKKELAKVKR